MPSDNIYAIATAAAKKAGYSDFDEGSDGEKKREEIVLALKRRGMKKATYGANNDQARKTGQRTSVERKPRLNPNKLGVSDVLNKARKDNPRKKPNIVAQGRENDLYPTGTQFAARAKDKSPVKKRFANAEEDNEHQLAVGRRDGETDKLSSPAGSTIQAEHVGAVSKAILKQGLLDTLLQKKDAGKRKPTPFQQHMADRRAEHEKGKVTSIKDVPFPYIDPSTLVWRVSQDIIDADKKADKESPFKPSNLAKEDDWPYKRFTREQAEKIANSRGLRSAANVTQTYLDEEEETKDDRQPRQKSRRSRNKRRRRGRNAQSTTVEDTIPSPEEKTETQHEFDMDVSEDKGENLPHGDNLQDPVQRGGSRRGSKAQKLIPPGDWQQKAREQGDGKGVDPTGKDPLRGRANKNNQLYSNADMGAMSYMAKTHLEQQPVSYDGDREARIKATRDHFKHLLLKTTCLCEKRGVVMAIGMKKGIGDVARGAVAGVKGAFQGAKQGIQDAKANPPSNKPMPTVAWPKGGDAGSQSIGLDPASQTKFKKIRSQVNRDIAGRAAAGDPKAQAARRVQDSVASKRIGDVARGIKPDTIKSGNGSPLASAEKPVAVMAAEQSGLYSVDGKNLDLDPMANKAPMESVNQTDAATRKASVNIDSRGRNTYIQLEDEPVEGDASEVITGLRKPPKLNRQQRRALEGKGTKNRPRRLDPGRNPAKNPGRKGQTSTKFGVSKSEPTICSSKAVFNSILEKTYYDDQVLERYKDSENGKNKRKSKSRHITNDITDTAGQQTNKTRGI